MPRTATAQRFSLTSVRIVLISSGNHYITGQSQVYHIKLCELTHKEKHIPKIIYFRNCVSYEVCSAALWFRLKYSAYVVNNWMAGYEICYIDLCFPQKLR